MSLDDMDYSSGQPRYSSRHLTQPESALDGYFEDARRILDEALEEHGSQSAPDPELSENFQTLRWFPLPGDFLDE
jgi:hypothetical protein